MSRSDLAYIARARSDEGDCLVEADEPLAGLQIRCGGAIGTIIAIPELLAVARKARNFGLRLSRQIAASDGDDRISAWVEVTPLGEKGSQGCEIGVVSWHREPVASQSDEDTSRLKIEIDRHLAELTARLGPRQNILSVNTDAPDLASLRDSMSSGIGSPWTDFVTLPELGHEQPMHWRLLDGARCAVEGSDRLWTATLVPVGQRGADSNGFELYLSAETPLQQQSPNVDEDTDGYAAPALGRDIAPILREPISRIIGNAETIRARLAGPLADEYSNYAADIGDAAQHLLGLIDDMADLEVVEGEDFTTAPDPIDLGDAVRRAAGMLSGKAQERRIELVLPGNDAAHPALAEFRRVIQILLNLMGNALRYAPEESTVSISLGGDGKFASVTVEDEGPGLDDGQQQAIFRKFERLGRSGDGGSGLGLYISRRIARAMGGDLVVQSQPGKGARFTLSVPAGD